MTVYAAAARLEQVPRPGARRGPTAANPYGEPLLQLMAYSCNPYSRSPYGECLLQL